MINKINIDGKEYSVGGGKLYRHLIKATTRAMLSSGNIMIDTQYELITDFSTELTKENIATLLAPRYIFEEYGGSFTIIKNVNSISIMTHYVSIDYPGGETALKHYKGDYLEIDNSRNIVFDINSNGEVTIEGAETDMYDFIISDKVIEL